MIETSIPVTRPDVRAVILEHDLHDASFQHTEYLSSLCACRKIRIVAPPKSSGDACFVCGGLTVRTGSCTTCTSCGSSGGCG